MRFCCRTLVVFLWAMGATLAGRAQYDTSFNTTYYGQKLSQFRLIPDREKGEIIFLGDSITDIAEWFELLKNARIRNRGISGDISFGVLHRLDEVTGRRPSMILLMIGINDVAANIPDSLIEKNYATIVDRIRRESPGTRIVLQSVLPTNDHFTDFPRHQHKTEHILRLNSYLQQLAKEKGISFVNLYPLFLNGEGLLSETYTNDGLHLTAAGYQVWINELRSKKIL